MVKSQVADIGANLHCCEGCIHAPHSFSICPILFVCSFVTTEFKTHFERAKVQEGDPLVDLYHLRVKSLTWILCVLLKFAHKLFRRRFDPRKCNWWAQLYLHVLFELSLCESQNCLCCLHWFELMTLVHLAQWKVLLYFPWIRENNLKRNVEWSSDICSKWTVC